MEMQYVDISACDPLEVDIRIEIENLSAGWETITLIFNDIKISFNASYIGSEPLADLIELVEALDAEDMPGSDESQYSVEWNDEPGIMELNFKHNHNSGRLTVEIHKSEDDYFNEATSRLWNISMPYSLFRAAVVKAAIDTLRKYGIQGFNQNWKEGSDTLPVSSLLAVLGVKTEFDSNLNAFKSDFYKELELLSGCKWPR